jgi:hypothetical protein
MPTDNDYGRDRFIRRNGQRLRVGMVRSIQPNPAETNADFERRMDQLADVLERMDGIMSVGYEFERRAGAIVQCVFDVDHAPRPETVTDDPRPAGGRSGTPRGGHRAN